MGKGYEQTLLNQRYLCSQQRHFKNLIITGHQRNANQNHNEIVSHEPEWLLLKSQNIQEQ